MFVKSFFWDSAISHVDSWSSERCKYKVFFIILWFIQRQLIKFIITLHIGLSQRTWTSWAVWGVPGCRCCIPTVSWQKEEEKEWRWWGTTESCRRIQGELKNLLSHADNFMAFAIVRKSSLVLFLFDWLDWLIDWLIDFFPVSSGSF